MKATEKQVRFAKFLLAENGFRTDWFDASFKRLGLTMRQRSGRIDDMSFDVASTIIDALKRS